MFGRLYSVCVNAVFPELDPELTAGSHVAHATGLTEIAIRSCIGSPGWMDCAPKTTQAEDALKGKWVLVTPDLNQKTGLWYLVR